MPGCPDAVRRTFLAASASRAAKLSGVVASIAGFDHSRCFPCSGNNIVDHIFD